MEELMQEYYTETVINSDGSLVVRDLPLKPGETVEVTIRVRETEAPSRNLKRKAGSLEGKIWMSDDFDDPLDDFGEYME
jgi:hypothetical protein